MRLHRALSLGYTLMELVVVMGLIAILFFAAAPRFMPRLLESRIETAAQRLATATQYLHAHTALTRSEATLRIDVAANEYWVTTPFVEDEGEGENEGMAGGWAKTDGWAETDVNFEDENFFGSDGKVLGIEFDLDKLIEGDDEKEEEEEMRTAFIARTTLPQGVRFVGLLMPNAEPGDEMTEFKIKYGPFGLKERAIIVLADDHGRKLSVRLDPVLGESFVENTEKGVLSALGGMPGGDELPWPEF